MAEKQVRLRMYNKSNKVYNVETVIGIRSTLYTGITKSVVKKDRRDVRVGPKTGISPFTPFSPFTLFTNKKLGFILSSF